LCSFPGFAKIAKWKLIEISKIAEWKSWMLTLWLFFEMPSHPGRSSMSSMSSSALQLALIHGLTLASFLRLRASTRFLSTSNRDCDRHQKTGENWAGT
jgi:hypothetical protein